MDPTWPFLAVVPGISENLDLLYQSWPTLAVLMGYFGVIVLQWFLLQNSLLV